MAKSGTHRSVVAALVANAAIMVAKAVAGFLSGSSSMLAEAFHSLADTANQSLLLLGMKRSKRRATAEYEFGHGRERFVWSFVVAINLFTLGAVFSFYEGIHKLAGDHAVPEHVGVSLIVLAIAFLFEGYSLNIARKQFQKLQRGRSVWQTIREAKNPEILIVTFEDTAALIGIATAAAGISLSSLTHDGLYDGVGSLVIGVLLGVVAVVLGREIKGMLVGEGLSPAEERKIRRIIRNTPEAEELLTMQSMHTSPSEALVNLHIQFNDELQTKTLEKVIRDLELRIKEAVPAARYIAIEPKTGE